MKKVNSSFYLAVSLSLFLLAACNTDDYNKESSSTEITVTDTVASTPQPMMTDTSQVMRMDTAGKAATTNTDATTKAKKGKVSTTMMSNTVKNVPMNQDKQGYYSSVEVLPMFPGGQNALNDFVNSNIEYPQDANDHSVEGVVTVNFAVDEAGKVSNPRIVGKPIGYGLEEEVLKAVNKMPTWTPGVIKGKNVKTYYTLPVNFRLEQ